MTDPTETSRGMTWGERLSDRSNPILVREILQALHGKMFMVTLSTAVAAVSLIGLGVVAFSADSGRDVFVASLIVLAPIIIFVLPLQAFMSMRHEVSAGMAEQLLLTGLSPRRIVGGKLLASLLMFVMFLGMFAPLLALTFLLRGIDVPTIIVMLTFAALASLVANAFAIGFASVGRVKMLSALTMIGAIGGLVMATVVCMAGAFELVREVQRGIASDEFPLVVGGAVLGATAAIWLLGSLAAAVLAHEHENRSTPFRLYVFFGVLLGAIWIALAAPGRHTDDIGPGAAAIMALVLAPVFIPLCCERSTLSPRVANYVPRRGWVAVLFVPFLPGGGRAMWLLLLTGGIAIAFGVALPLLHGERPDRSILCVALAAWSYLWIFCAIGRFVRERFQQIPSRFWTAIVIVLACFVLGIVLTLVLYAIGGHRQSWTLLHLGNVPWTLHEIDRRRAWEAPAVLGVIAVVALIVLARNMMRDIREVRTASAERASRGIDEADRDGTELPVEGAPHEA